MYDGPLTEQDLWGVSQLVRRYGIDAVREAVEAHVEYSPASVEPTRPQHREEEETNPGPYCEDGEFYFDVNGRSIGPYATEEDAEEAFDDLTRELYQEEIRATRRAESGYAQ